LKYQREKTIPKQNLNERKKCCSRREEALPGTEKKVFNP